MIGWPYSNTKKSMLVLLGFSWQDEYHLFYVLVPKGLEMREKVIEK